MLLTLLQKAMKDRRLTVRQTAAQIGVSHTTITRLLQGSSYDLDTGVSVCNWLGVPPAQVLGLSGSDPLEQALSSILVANPALRRAFEKVLDPIENNVLDVAVLEDILQYIAFRLSQTRGPIRSTEEDMQSLLDF